MWVNYPMIRWFFSQRGRLIDNWSWTEVKRVIVIRLSISLYLSISPSRPRHSISLPSSSLSVSPTHPLLFPLSNPLHSRHLPSPTRRLPIAPRGLSHWLPSLSLRNDFVTLLAKSWCQSPSAARPLGAPITSMACVKHIHTHKQALLARGQGQKLINQILLSAVKLLSLPACILNKTALKHINTQADTHPKHWAIGQKHQASLGFGTVSVCVHARFCLWECV